MAPVFDLKHYGNYCAIRAAIRRDDESAAATDADAAGGHRR